MRDELVILLNLRRLPGRLTAAQAAAVLGFAEHDTQTLVRERLLKPLGGPSRHSAKFFAGCDIESLSRDAAWLGKACKAVSAYWAKQNHKRASKRRAEKTTELMAA